jgi:hypothetical protein
MDNSEVISATWTFTVTHPQLGTNVLVLPGQTSQSALDQYNAVLGFIPPGDPIYPLDPQPYPILGKAQIANLRRMGVTVVHDPANWLLISLDDYELKYPAGGILEG